MHGEYGTFTTPETLFVNAALPGHGFGDEQSPACVQATEAVTSTSPEHAHKLSKRLLRSSSFATASTRKPPCGIVNLKV